MIRVGRCKYNGGKRVDPSYEGFTPIIVMMKSHSKWYPLSPYELRDEKGRIHENIWQYSKTYKSVPKSVQRYSRYNPTIIWDHPAEVHVNDDNMLTQEYLRWRKKGMSNPYAVRYPVGYNHRHKCICAFPDNANGDIDFSRPLDYVQSRKVIYLPIYSRLAKQTKEYQELKQRLNNGENLLIVEVDGPHQESLDYYQQKYQVDNTFIVGDTMLITPENIEIMLNDTKHPFGHGYCLAMALLDM